MNVSAEQRARWQMGAGTDRTLGEYVREVMDRETADIKVSEWPSGSNGIQVDSYATRKRRRCRGCRRERLTSATNVGPMCNDCLAEGVVPESPSPRKKIVHRTGLCPHGVKLTELCGECDGVV